ncbi:MAG: heavy metal-binding domain-containing protein [Lactobacillaceae bacterium]|nr:heavy metal-binding domain-containing protein [Lactobacillaceae bacterium]
MAADILVVTTENIPGYHVTAVYGEVFGVTSRSRDIVSNIGAGLKTLVGGKIGAMTTLVETSRNESIQNLRDAAQAKGANAVVMMRFDTEAIMEGVSATVAYGTAVTIEAN